MSENSVTPETRNDDSQVEAITDVSTSETPTEDGVETTAHVEAEHETGVESSLKSESKVNTEAELEPETTSNATPGFDPHPGMNTAPGLVTEPIPPRSASVPEQPARGIRVALLVWAGIVAITGILLLTLPHVGLFEMPMLLIGLVALLGCGLIGAALVSLLRRE